MLGTWGVLLSYNPHSTSRFGVFYGLCRRQTLSCCESMANSFHWSNYDENSAITSLSWLWQSKVSFVWPTDWSRWLEVLLPLSVCIFRSVDHFVLTSILLACDSDSAVAHCAYIRTADIDWSSNDGVQRWFPVGVSHGHVPELVEALFP